MREPYIPEIAYAAGENAAVGYVPDVDAIDVASDVLRAGARFIVAAELRRLADSVLARLVQPVSDYVRTAASVVDELRARADELDAS